MTPAEKPTKEQPDPQKVEAPRTILGFILLVFGEIRRQKKWYLLPLWILLAAIALALLFSGSSYILPAIYISF